MFAVQDLLTLPGADICVLHGTGRYRPAILVSGTRRVPTDIHLGGLCPGSIVRAAEAHGLNFAGTIGCAAKATIGCQFRGRFMGHARHARPSTSVIRKNSVIGFENREAPLLRNFKFRTQGK